MITAKEALALTQESLRGIVTEKYDSMIKKAAAEGRRRLELDYELTVGEGHVLSECGYDFEWNGEITTIWW